MGLTVTKVIDTVCCCWGKDKETKKVKRTKKRSQKTSGTRTQKATINAYWETLHEHGSLTPSQIPNNMLTREVKFDSEVRQLNNEFEFDKKVLETEKYEVMNDSIIGKGGTGRVYKIKHKITGEIMASKVTELVKRETISKTRFESFKNEIFILGRNPHRNIIQLKDHFICNQSISFIIMEFANAGDLEHRLKEQNKPFDEKMAKHYFVQISNAIYFLHSKGIVHGDLKLPNVLISKFGNKEVIKVTDFGCSRIVYTKGTGIIMKTKAIGTVSYMSPEMIVVYIGQNLQRPDLVKNIYKRYNPFKADIWAMGICLYKLVNFHRPFAFGDKRDPTHMLQMVDTMKKGFLLKQTIFKQLSRDCIELMKSLLEYDRYKRIDIQVVVTTNWVISSDQLDLKGLLT